MTETYMRRVEQGLCVRCGKHEPVKGNRLCQECKDKMSRQRTETRRILRENGICPVCGKNKIFEHEYSCPECKAYKAENAIKNRDKTLYNKKMREYHYKERNERRKNGFCTICGKRKADYGFVSCGICRDKETRYMRAKYGKPDRGERYKQGLCYFCDKPIKTGYKVCEKHYGRMLEMAHSEKMKEARKEIQKNWI
jgi:hypothetical protein